MPRGGQILGALHKGTLCGALRENAQLKEYFEKKYL